MSVHTLKKTQLLRTDLATAWQFFATPLNLEKLTPPDVGFEILSELPPTMHPGMIIRYRIRALLGLPMTWVTEITQVQHERFFVDDQRIGPYKLWHHQHHFRDLGDGTVEMTDIVTYALPFGPLTAPVHALLVGPKLRQIFDYREKSVREIFG